MSFIHLFRVLWAYSRKGRSGGEGVSPVLSDSGAFADALLGRVVAAAARKVAVRMYPDFVVLLEMLYSSRVYEWWAGLDARCSDP